MAAYRNPRSFSIRRPTHGTSSPRCCYPYTPASPQPSRPNPDHRLVTQPLFPNSTPVTRSLPENPTSDLALPSLEHLANALHALAGSRSRRRERRRPSRSRDRRTTRDLPEPDQAAVHVPASTWTFETTSPKTPKRKLHYVPATPSALYSPPPAIKHFSPVPAKETLPTPPPSHASSSPRQLPSSPPKRHYTPAPVEVHAPVPAPVLAIEAPPAVEPPPVSKFTRLVLAGRETAADDAAIQALMSSFDRIADSLDCDDEDEDECRSELSID